MSNPRGFAEWNPNRETRVILSQVDEVLREYREYLPMTARQVFYRLVGQYGFEKTEKAYKRLCSYLVRARRARYIPFDSIRDDGTVEEGGGGWNSRSAFWSAVESNAEYFRLNRQNDQPYRIEIWTEAAGMAPMVSDMVDDLSIPVYSTGGFSSVTVTHEVSRRVVRYGQLGTPTVFLHIGDYDPSGVSIFESMAEDIGAFVASKRPGGPDVRLYGQDGYPGQVNDWFYPRRVALTSDQVAEYDLPTAPPKATDSRSTYWYDQTTQLEAMPPNLLSSTIREAVDTYVDQSILEATIQQESEDRAAILEALESVS